MMITDFFTPSLSSVVAALNLLILGAVYPCTGIGNYCGTDNEDSRRNGKNPMIEPIIIFHYNKI